MKSLIKEKYNIDFPDDPYKQLELSIAAIFKSWMEKKSSRISTSIWNN
jgi:hypothetical protein